MESPRAPMELGYPVRFGAGTAATVPRASKTAGRHLRNRRIVPPQPLVPRPVRKHASNAITLPPRRRGHGSADPALRSVTIRRTDIPYSPGGLPKVDHVGCDEPGGLRT